MWPLDILGTEGRDVTPTQGMENNASGGTSAAWPAMGRNLAVVMIIMEMEEIIQTMQDASKRTVRINRKICTEVDISLAFIRPSGSPEVASKTGEMRPLR